MAHEPERVTPYGARLIITQICSSFTAARVTRAILVAHVRFLARSFALSGAHSDRYNFANLRSDLCICYGPFVKSDLYTGYVPDIRNP